MTVSFNGTVFAPWSGQSSTAAQTVSLPTLCGNAHLSMAATQAFSMRVLALEARMYLLLDASHVMVVPSAGIHSGPLLETGAARTIAATILSKVVTYIFANGEFVGMVGLS